MSEFFSVKVKYVVINRCYNFGKLLIIYEPYWEQSQIKIYLKKTFRN